MRTKRSPTAHVNGIKFVSAVPVKYVAEAFHTLVFTVVEVALCAGP